MAPLARHSRYYQTLSLWGPPLEQPRAAPQKVKPHKPHSAGKIIGR